MLTTPVLIPESLFGWCPSLFLNYSRLCNLFLHYYFFVHIFFDGSSHQTRIISKYECFGIRKNISPDGAQWESDWPSRGSRTEIDDKLSIHLFANHNVLYCVAFHFMCGNNNTLSECFYFLWPYQIPSTFSKVRLSSFKVQTS